MAEEKFKLQSSKKKKRRRKRKERKKKVKIMEMKNPLLDLQQHISAYLYVLLEVMMDFSLC